MDDWTKSSGLGLAGKIVMTLVVAKAMGTSGGEVVYRPEALLLLV